MWGNGIALPCAMFVMEGISMILSEEDADEQK
jgi:DNA (cytosine-5)-methyltransferase 1